jgi:hypothetical protein
MNRGLEISHRPPLTACVAALALVLALGSSAAALAGTPYTVRVEVSPSSVSSGSSFKVTASGVSNNPSQLKVFVNTTKKCAATAAANAVIPGDSVQINGRVTGAYSKARTLTAANAGGHYACAYLAAPAPSTSTRAHASAYYTVSPGFY